MKKKKADQATSKKPRKAIIIGAVVLAIVIIGTIGGTPTDESAPTASTPPAESTPAAQEKTASPEEIKAHAGENDLEIASAVWSAKQYNGNLSEQIQGMSTGETALADVYAYAGETQDFMRELLDRVDAVELSSEVGTAYKDAAHSYISNIYLISTDMREFIDTNEYSKFESVQEGLQVVSYAESEFTDARTAYLKDAGFTDEEIAARPTLE